MFGWIVDWFARWYSRREELRLSQMSVRELNAVVLDVFRANGWESFAGPLIDLDSADELLVRLVRLHERLHKHDIKTSSSLSNRDGESFQFYDQGLGAVVDSLQARGARIVR